MPGYPYDCRLLMTTAIRDCSLRTEDEIHEDNILIREFCEKVRISGKDLVLPPLSGLPNGYKMNFKRKAQRKSYSYEGYDLITSVETSIRYDAVDHPEEQTKIDIHIFSGDCDKLLSKDQGHDWKPSDIINFIPKMMKFVKDDLSSVLS
ncbi:uncharacterized protein LOC134179130 [Corticium candelabrum]|uniref:uncharacterized protein LOC134179130 n=1 Tax=Corticium candelabrum TaxID=121492 RepID=UPI002E25AFEB|nr:uncharacterized protein LOC134179130 [Corticium candelabrum]